MRPLRYSINVTLDGCCDHSVVDPDEELHRRAVENLNQADGLLFGRVANFVNAELVGRTTDVPWGMIFPGDTVPRHPSQLYEALLEGPLLLLVLWAVWRAKRPTEGRTAALFLILYGAFRFAVEFTRQPDPQLGFIAFRWLTMGQLLSALERQRRQSCRSEVMAGR